MILDFVILNWTLDVGCWTFGVYLNRLSMLPRDPAIFGIPIDFVLFGLTLICVAVFHQHTMRVALAGLVAIVVYKVLFTGFKTGPGFIGFLSHVKQEWVILANLLCLLWDSRSSHAILRKAICLWSFRNICLTIGKAASRY